ncbi:MAG: protein translocase subunit SecDF, partial [Lachnospiraceae bacterium]|nr:protein translocase subunit SecDF [Lachnospiraceae bacterium]
MNQKKNNTGKGILCLLGLLIVIAVCGFFAAGTLQKSKLVTDENGATMYQEGGIKLGLDLAGGVSITYKTKIDEPSAEDMSDTQYKLMQRVQNYSSEAEVYQEGTNRINIDIPGVSDANKVLEELGKPGSLLFFDMNQNVVLEGSDVAAAEAATYKDQTTGAMEYTVRLQFTEEGTKKFADVTTANVGKQIAIVYDGVMYSNPVVNEPITGGQCTISGMESYEEAS